MALKTSYPKPKRNSFTAVPPIDADFIPSDKPLVVSLLCHHIQKVFIPTAKLPESLTEFF